MKRLRTVICLTLMVVVSVTVMHCYNVLPLRTNELTAEKYRGWSGVLRIWFCDTLKSKSGSVSNWLNRCAYSFESNNEGVYVQIQQTDAFALETLCENSIIPPDIIIFPSGLITKPSHLIPLKEEKRLLAGLASSGTFNGIVYAQPIALGGYCWVYNTADMNSIPFTLGQTDAIISSLPDSNSNNWSSVLTALYSGRYFSYEEMATQSPSSDIDLGLSIFRNTPEPALTPEPPVENFKYCSLPENFNFTQSAFSDFTSGNISAMPASQYEIIRLKNMSDQGKGPAWNAASSGDISYTDQIIFAAIVDKANHPEKQMLCESFISHVLSDECQQDIHRAGLFSSTGVDSGYDNHDPLKIIEKALTEKPLYATGAFDTYNNEYFYDIVRKFLENGGFSQDLYMRLLSLIP